MTYHVYILQSLKDGRFYFGQTQNLNARFEKHNNALAERYNEEGVFPKVILLDQNQNVISELRYDKGMTAKSFINQLDSKIKKQ